MSAFDNKIAPCHEASGLFNVSLSKTCDRRRSRNEVNEIDTGFCYLMGPPRFLSSEDLQLQGIEEKWRSHYAISLVSSHPSIIVKTARHQ